MDAIRKKAREDHNLRDYASERVRFSWSDARRRLDGLPGGGLNIAHEAVFRHAASDRRDTVAIRHIDRMGRATDLTYGGLAAQVARFANVLETLGVSKEERVFLLLGRVPELYISALGTLASGAVLCPLFSAFGPEPILERLVRGDAKVLVTSRSLYARKVSAVRERAPRLEHVLTTGGETQGTRAFADLLAAASTSYRPASTRPEDMALLHFTSGTTGRPKGAVHVHEAVVAHDATARYALDLRDDDVFWCTADPGWVTGTSYGIIAPLVIGATMVVDEREFDADRWYEILQNHGVSVWYTAPTAIRMMMKVGIDAVREYRFDRLRFMASVGEPLNPEAVLWGQEAFGRPFHDNWWQTETGGIMIANFAAMDVRPGSMGKPLPGIEAAIVQRSDTGVEVIDAPNVQGELALRTGWPSMFRGYLHDDARYAKCFADGWYLSGDLARRDEEGYFWFVGRGDDVIKSAGHLIGPFEVESALLEHRAVAEAGVIGRPDPVAGEVVKAFVSLNPGHAPSAELEAEILGFARRRLGAAVAPRVLTFTDDLPHTRSGKIMRRLLKARELGLPEGDLSTLEGRE